MKKAPLIVIVIVILAVIGGWWQFSAQEQENVNVTTFEECAAAGNPVMESYPRQCRHGDQTYVENIGNELEKMDLIRLSTPRPNQTIKSPLTIEGEARGTWFFEGDFSIVLTDWDGLIIAEGFAQAEGEWMTEEFVPFSATLLFTNPTYKNTGTLILKKDNPSDLPEHDDALEVPIFFDESGGGSSGILPFDSGVTGKVLLGPDMSGYEKPV